MLPSYALPSHSLPFRALLLISEYSKPLTRSDWRKSKPCVSTYMLFVYSCSVTHRMPCKLRFYKLYQIILTNIMKTCWYNLYINIQSIGMHTTSINVKIPIQQLKQISGLNEAERHYKNRS
jgi:hypothetical protein